MSMVAPSISDHLKELTRVLADWSAHTTSVTIYLFGSRVRGDHHAGSDVDVSIPLKGFTEADIYWWGAMNDNCFVDINAQLPGPLSILENADPITQRVLEAAKSPVYQDRNVICVLMPPKPF